MASTGTLSAYIKKLSHPLREIRERALQLLAAKFRLGWQLDDELAGTRVLLEALLAWFDVPEPTLQQEALQLLLNVIRTETGHYIAKEYGIKKIILHLNKCKSKMNTAEIETLDDVAETLQFQKAIVSEENINIPPLTLNSIGSSESDDCSGSSYYNIGQNSHGTNGSSVSNSGTENIEVDTKADAVKVLLFPWVELGESDCKTLKLVEDALKLMKSTRRCCRFICDVFLRDFPAEIFLNRPVIVQHLLTISENGSSGRRAEVLHVLLSITRALSKRLCELSSLELVNDMNQILIDSKESDDRVNLALEDEALDIAGDCLDIQPNDDLAALKQLPAPMYCLKTLQTVLTILSRDIVFSDAGKEVLDTKELNTCLNLVDSLLDLLLECVADGFWSIEHGTKTHRDIAHKSTMVMRILGDLMMKYRKQYFSAHEAHVARAAWLRLAACAARVASWARAAAVPPACLVLALQAANLDVAVDILYPDLAKRVAHVLENAKMTNQEHKSKVRELTQLYACMEEAAQFMKSKQNRNSKKVLEVIRDSLPALELHLNEDYLFDVANILLHKLKEFDLNDNGWSVARGLALNLMAHNVEWVRVTFYKHLSEMVHKVLVNGDDGSQTDTEQNLTLICDVGILTEICCHGIPSESDEVSRNASDIMVYLVRGRMVLSEAAWWRLLASLLPVLPLLHVYAAHDTMLGQAICKSLEPDIAECMGVSMSEVTMGLVRLLFVRCPSVQLDAAHTLCRLLDDERYLPPKESLRTDVLTNALRRVDPTDFNVDYTSSPSKCPQTSGLIQILDVLKQDIVSTPRGPSTSRPALEPSLRRSTLQQLAVVARQTEHHEAFLQNDGVDLVVAILRKSMMVDDFLAFPECAISCVSVLNSVSFAARHTLAKIPDFPALLLRVILVFPAHESAVGWCAQLLALTAWAGFALQELDARRRRVPALPKAIVHRLALPFHATTYWNQSANKTHSSVEWVMSDPDCRMALRTRWWVCFAGARGVVSGAPPPPAPLALRPAPADRDALRDACPQYSCTRALMQLENATSHRQVIEALGMLETYVRLLPWSANSSAHALPWGRSGRFLAAPPASPRDVALLMAMLQFFLAYMENVPDEGNAMSWIISAFLGSEATVISLLSREELYPQQSAHDRIEVTQLQIHIVKVLRQCVMALKHEDGYHDGQIESLLKILLACLERIDLKNFHMLGLLNELLRCIRYTLYSEYCSLSEETVLHCMKVIIATLSGCASGGGRKGQACRLDAMVSLLALLQQAHTQAIPVQKWCEWWSGAGARELVRCAGSARAGLRAAALRVAASLALHAQAIPQLEQAIPAESLTEYAVGILCEVREANAVRTAAAYLIVSIAARASPHSEALETDVLNHLAEHNFVEMCVEILINFCNEKQYQTHIEPNVPASMLERLSLLEVRARKCGDVRVSPAVPFYGRPPPTAGLVAALADLMHNLGRFPRFPVQMWDERGVYRLLFRCASWPGGPASSALGVQAVRAACCRALAAAAAHRCVRATLANAADCVHALVATVAPVKEEAYTRECQSARTQALWLLGALLAERGAAAAAWRTLGERAKAFTHGLLQALQWDNADLQQAALFCLKQLAQSVTSKKNADNREPSRLEILENLKSPYLEQDYKEHGAGDSARNECRPDYMIEELCKALMKYYATLSSETNFLNNQEDNWKMVCACLSSVLCASARARAYCAHGGLPLALLSGMRRVRDARSLHGNADAMKNASSNPTLTALYWLLTLITCQMLEHPAAKEVFADEGIALSLNRLWPWCMLTEQLREAAMRLLLTFSNDCPKAWASMSACVSGRTLIGEACAVAAREAGSPRRPAPALLLLALRTVHRTLAHHQCRAIVLKSEVLPKVHRVVVRERLGLGVAGALWAAACERAARWADGAAAVLPLRPPAGGPARAAFMPALAHAARHRRAAVLQAPDILELLSGTLLAGDTAEVVSAARAVWALAANNHKAKLVLRSAGIPASVSAALQRMQRAPRDPAAARAATLLLYTHTVLQAT